MLESASPELNSDLLSIIFSRSEQFTFHRNRFEFEWMNGIPQFFQFYILIFSYIIITTQIYNFVLWNNKKRKKRKKIESDLVKSLSLHNVNLYLKSSYWTQHRPQTWYRVIYSICINSNSRSNCLSKSKLGELKLLQQTQTWGQFIENSKNSFNYLIIYQSYIRS